MSSTPVKVGVVMGSSSDWGVMQHAALALQSLGVAHEARVVSAHRTPELLFEYAKSAAGRGLHCIIAGAGGAAHLPGMLAAITTLPVLHSKSQRINAGFPAIRFLLELVRDKIPLPLYKWLMPPPR